MIGSYILKTSTISIGITNFRKIRNKINNYEFTVFFRDINFHTIKFKSRKATNKTQYFDTLSDLQFSPYVPIQLIPVGVERSNGTPMGTSRLIKLVSLNLCNNYAPDFEKVDGAYCIWSVGACVHHTFCTYCNF